MVSNQGDVGWLVSEAWEFMNPIPLSYMEDAVQVVDPFQTSVKLGRREVHYKEAIEREIQLLT